MKKEFNLLDENWVRVLLPGYTVKEVSLKDVFTHSHEYMDLAGETDTQNVAMIRLLLAVAHSGFARFDSNGNEIPLSSRDEAISRWKSYWSLGHFPEAFLKYLEEYRERFWLFHPDAPFYQANEAKKGTAFGAAKLNGEISESNNKVRIFATRSGEAKMQLTYAEAARWLLFINGYDDVSVKPSRAGLPSISIGWLGQNTIVYAIGRNLFETLMMNLVPLQNGNGELWPKPCPIWECLPRSDERKKIDPPSTPAELFTHQSRRIFLKRENGVITGFNALGGEFFDKERVVAETMALYILNSNSAKPLRLFNDVPLWQLLDKILYNNQDTVTWLRLIGISSAGFQTCGMMYDSKAMKFVDECSKRFTTNLDPNFADYISVGIELCRYITNEIGVLSYNIQMASGEQNPTELKKYEFSSNLDLIWSRFLSSSATAFEYFLRMVKQSALDFSKSLIDNASPTSFRGRIVAVNGTEKYYCTPKAYNSFLYYLNRLIPEESNSLETIEEHLSSYNADLKPKEEGE